MKTVKKGDALTFKDRLWAIVDPYGHIARDADGPLIFSRRDTAIKFRRDIYANYKLVRIGDLTGVVQ